MKKINYKVTDSFTRIVRPKEGEYYIYRNNLLKIVSASNCERCFFYSRGFCLLMFLENGNIHCDYDSNINFLYLKKVIDVKP